MAEEKYKVISFYLDSNEPRYTVGAIANALYAPIVYPGWVCEFNLTNKVLPEVSQRIDELPHTSINRLESDDDDYSSMFFRFESLSNPKVGAVIFRDCDCRLNKRGKQAVDQWMESDKDFHIMHDHVKLPFFPQGCWGVKQNGLPNIKNIVLNFLELISNRPWEKMNLINQHGKLCYKKECYTRFLESVIYPISEFSLMRHDDSTKNISGIKIGIPFPTQKTLDSGYVGETYTLNETPEKPSDRISTVDDFAKTALMYSESEKTRKTEDMFEYGRKVFQNLREARESLQ